MNDEKRCIGAIRCLSMDAIQRANSGHPGAPLGLAPAGYALWTKIMRHSPSNPDWVNRDRFILSCGHASMLLYSLLFLSGYGLELDDIRNFRQWESKTPGHPEHRITPGVETSTGPLGQGIGNAVGMAIAERWLANRFNRAGHEIIDHLTYAFAGDGDLMEGVAIESCSLAGHLGLEKLIVLWDNNGITIEGSTNLAISEDILARFKAQGWRVLEVDGQDVSALVATFQTAKTPSGKPTLIACRTIIGWPSPNKQNTSAAHGAPLGEEEVRATKIAMGWETEKDFAVPEDILAEWRECIKVGAEFEAAWKANWEKYCIDYPELSEELKTLLDGGLGASWQTALPTFNVGEKIATREASGQILNAVAPHIPQLVGGSADLAPSNNTFIKGQGTFDKTCAGRNFHFGIREHAMGAILNGMSLHGGLRPFGATFLVFCDYMRPSMRLAALMKQPVIYVFTHDSIGVGEDGPTHQPIEHLMGLRIIPGLTVIRPADATETNIAWSLALNDPGRPVALILSRQKLPVLDADKTRGADKGGYVLEEASSSPRLIVVATGSEVHTAIDARTILESEGIPTRVVSLPSWEVFEAQDVAYHQTVFPTDVPAISIEAGVTAGWGRYAKINIGIDHFGASAPAEILFEKFGITPSSVVEAAKLLLQAIPQ
ncbi:MAG: transketolase [Holophagaceae bacterium]|nr:transketolase [Holophagaceae bacterium]